jgi:probable rRNA maturation factor
MIDVVNLQRKIKIDTAVFRSYVAELSASVAEAQENLFSVAFISDRRMKELNGLFRDKDSTTDVLSFPHAPEAFEIAEPGSSTFIGDIVISAEQAERQAKENKLSLELEIKQLILHGLLHLCGYDHETDDGEMNKRELALRRKLKIA